MKRKHASTLEVAMNTTKKGRQISQSRHSTLQVQIPISSVSVTTPTSNNSVETSLIKSSLCEADRGYGNIVYYPAKHQPGIVLPANWQEQERPHGIYYKDYGEHFGVRVGHMVLRRRIIGRSQQQEEQEVLDGPWRIEKFCNRVHDKHELISKESYTRSDAKKKMLSTKVRLDFPSTKQFKSEGPAWVEVGELIPLHWGMTEGYQVRASSLTISEMASFKQLVDPSHLNEDDDIPVEDLIQDALRKKREQLWFAEIKSGLFVAVTHVEPTSQSPTKAFEVEKLRAKRLRVLDSDNLKAQTKGLTTEQDDLWVARFLKDYDSSNMIVTTQYQVHWAGWASEDDTWEYGHEIPQSFKNEYNACHLEESFDDAKKMVFKKDIARIQLQRKAAWDAGSEAELVAEEHEI